MTAALVVGIVMAAGAIIGGLTNTIVEATKADGKYNDNKTYLDDKKANDLALLELDFNQNKEEANRIADRKNKEADLSDKQQDVAENGLSADFNAALDSIQDQQLENTYDWNYYAINAGQNEGQAAAKTAASGVRSGSSLETAIDLESALNSQQLQLSEDISRRQNSNQLDSMNFNLKGNMMNIESNRIQADWNREDAALLRKSFEQGGSNWNIYQNKQKGVDISYNYNLRNVERERDEWKGWNLAFKIGTAALGAGSSGFQTGYSIGKSFSEYAPKTGTK